MTVADGSSGWEYDMWQVRSKPRDGGTLTLSWGGRTRVDGDGLGSDATAARSGSLAGIIRAPELEAGQIDHACSLVAICDSGAHVYPAVKSGRPCTASALRTQAHPRLEPGSTGDDASEIAPCRSPHGRRTILTAMARYGMYVCDTGGALGSPGRVRRQPIRASGTRIGSSRLRAA